MGRTMVDVRHVLEANNLNLDELRELKRLVARNLRDAEEEEHRRIAACEPKDLLPESWQLYDKAEDGGVFPGYPEAKAAMDECGVALCVAIRSKPVAEWSPMEAIKSAMKAMNECRSVHSSCGATDTAVREALGDFFDKCCVGTRYDGYCDELWEKVSS